jgi:DNA polymerase-3 subunit delta'
MDIRDINTNWGIFGHEWAVELLQGHIIHRSIRHAYLITGPQGIGRRTLAIRFAQAINCTQLVSAAIPCGRCRACRLIENMQHPDFSIVQAEDVGMALKVDQIRELQRTLSLTPYEAHYKIALILRFEQANPNAANALLKTLEEPPPHVIMMLTASDSDALLPTINSRCELIQLRPLSVEQVTSGLQTNLGIPADKATLLSHISAGRPGYALQLIQNPEILEQRQIHLDDILGLLSKSRVDRFAYAEHISKDRATLLNALQIWLTLWRDVMLRVAGSITPIINVDRENEILALAEKIDLITAQNIVRKIGNSIVKVEKYINARLITEILMLDLPYLS